MMYYLAELMNVPKRIREGPGDDVRSVSLARRGIIRAAARGVRWQEAYDV